MRNELTLRRKGELRLGRKIAAVVAQIELRERMIYSYPWLTDSDCERLDREISDLKRKQNSLYSLSMEGQL